MGLRQRLQDELGEIEGSYTHEITPEKQKRARALIRTLAECVCRNCGKKYDFRKSRADLQGFCSAKCQHAKAHKCGYRKGKALSEFQCLKLRREVGNEYVIHDSIP